MFHSKPPTPGKEIHVKPHNKLDLKKKNWMLTKILDGSDTIKGKVAKGKKTIPSPRMRSTEHHKEWKIKKYD